jgi:signal transduction histidine kinase
MSDSQKRTTRRWGRSFRFDLAVALLLTAVVQVQMWTAGYEDAIGPAGSGAVVALLQTLPLIWRRRRPVIVFLVTMLATAIPPAIGGLGDNAFGFIGPLVALYTVAAYRVLRIALACYLVAGLAATLLHQLPQLREFDPIYLFLPWVPFAAALFLGIQVRLRRKYAAALEDREALIERRRHTHAVEAVARERSRIARELHDVVGHSLSIIAVQSGAARMNFDSRPEQAREAISSIEQTAGQATEEMARLLSIMGASENGSTEGGGLDEVDALIERVRQAGIDVALRREGEPLELSPGLDLSAYRILQEALTNVLKYGGGKPAEVVLRFRPHDLELEVTNEAGGRESKSTGPSGGQGLIGMRERVALFSGEFTATPTETGGFTVMARMPLEAVG